MTQEIEAPCASYRVPTGAEIREYLHRVNEAADAGRARFVSPGGVDYPLVSVEAGDTGLETVRMRVHGINGSFPVDLSELAECIEVRETFARPYEHLAPAWVKGGAL